MDVLKQGSDWLQDMQARHASQAVVYSSGAGEVTLRATLGRTQYALEDESGLRVRAEAMDFLVAAEELILDGQRTQPQVGDRICINRGENLDVFEVMDLAGQGHWRFSDPFGKTFRIHTKLIGTE